MYRLFSLSIFNHLAAMILKSDQNKFFLLKFEAVYFGQFSRKFKKNKNKIEITFKKCYLIICALL